MIGGLILLLLTTALAYLLVNQVTRAGSKDNRLLKQLFFYHVLLALVYFAYVSFNPSDSKFYYEKVITDYRGDTWFSFYGTSTTFIEFVGYPFIRYLGFSYEAIMALFAFFGYVGFVFFYLAFKERIRFQHQFFGLNLLTLIFFLPNLHFWSSSFGKGSIIFMGIAFFFYGIIDLRKRFLWLILGGVIIYHVRPHIMLVMLVSYLISFLFTSKGVNLTWRLRFLAGGAVAVFFIYQDVLSLVGIDDEQIATQSLDLSHRARELGKATSGVDINSYSLPFQLFTFLYRPLFIDAPGALGLFVSLENVFYLLITIKLLSRVSGWRFLFTGDFLSKGALLSFLTISIALAQIAGNLGLAIRQKSQVMILLLFVILAYLDNEKMKVWKAQKARSARRKQQQPINSNIGVASNKT